MKYEARFLYADWEEVLEGKKVVLTDSISELKETLSDPSLLILTSAGHNSVTVDLPFIYGKTGSAFRYCYYDPNLVCKLAFEQGKQIQIKTETESWVDIMQPTWQDGEEYRIKPTERDPKELLGKIVTVTGRVGIVNEYDYTTQRYFVAGSWYTEEELKNRNVTEVEI